MIGLVGFLVEALVSEAAPTSLVARNRVPTPSPSCFLIFVRPSLYGRRLESAGPAGRVVETLPQRLRGTPRSTSFREADLRRSSRLSSRRPVLEEGKLRGGRRDSLRRNSSTGLCIPYDEASQKRIRPLDLRAQGELTLAAASSEKQRKERAVRARRSERPLR